MKPFNPLTLIAWITAALVAFIALAALGISFGNLFTLADANQFGKLSANLWAAVVDVFIVAATLSVLRTSLQNISTAYSWTLVVITTVISVIFNVWHAATLLQGFMRAIPPVALFLAFHLLMEQIKAWVKTQTLTHSLADLAGQVADKAKELTDLKATIQDTLNGMDEKIQTRESKRMELDATLKEKKAELKDTIKQTEDAQRQLADILAEVRYASEDRPDRITERRDIGKLLFDKGIAVPDIAAYFKVNPKTIERDLNGHMQKAN